MLAPDTLSVAVPASQSTAGKTLVASESAGADEIRIVAEAAGQAGLVPVTVYVVETNGATTIFVCIEFVLHV